MLLSEVQGKAEIIPDYFIAVEAGDNLVLRIGFEQHKALSTFEHPLILAAVPEIFEYKHEARNGRKWWTQAAGTTFYIAVPKNKIEIVAEHGYSYPKVIINGQNLRLNVTGGTLGGKGWTDIIRSEASVGVNLSKKTLLALLAVAVKQEITVRRMDTDSDVRWQQLYLEKTIVNLLTPGVNLYFRDGSTFVFMGTQKQMLVASRLGTTFPYRLRIKELDLVRTAEEQKYSLPSPDAVNFVGNVLPSHDDEHKAKLCANEGNYVSGAAWGDWHDAVPKGSTGVVAHKIGANGKIGSEEKYFLIPEDQYEPRMIFAEDSVTPWVNPDVPTTKQVSVQEFLVNTL